MSKRVQTNAIRASVCFEAGDCVDLLSTMPRDFFDGVLTSPPYNLGSNPRHRTSSAADAQMYACGGGFFDAVTASEYVENTVALFRQLERVVKPRGVVLWNMGMSTKNSGPLLPSRVIVAVADSTDWTLGDCVYWNKNRAVPFQTSPNKCSPFVEPVYVFCRKAHVADFGAQKPLGKRSAQGQQFYKPVPNIFEAPPGRSTALNKATFSTEMATKLLSMYFARGARVLDPFAGSGTTLRAAEALGMFAHGIDIDSRQVEAFGASQSTS